MSAGHWAWVGLVLGVIGYDVWAIRTGHNTMSRAFWLMSRSRYGLIVIAIWAWLTAHLFGLFPDGWDPLEWFA